MDHLLSCLIHVENHMDHSVWNHEPLKEGNLPGRDLRPSGRQHRIPLGSHMSQGKVKDPFNKPHISPGPDAVEV